MSDTPDTRTTENPEPRTEAGRRFVENWNLSLDQPVSIYDLRADIAAIEAEAAQRAAPRAEGLDVERLRQHEPEPGLGLAGTSWRWDCSCGWYIEDGDAQRWWTHVLSAARLAPQERRD